MKRALAGKPVLDFVTPAGVTFALINPLTGRLARQGSEGSVMECFIAGTEPNTYDDEAPRPGPAD
jgi:penicillin-binding protein 1A